MAVFKSRITQQIVNFVVFAICISVSLLGFSSIKVINSTKSNLSNTIEQTWREQARRTLNDLREQFITEVNKGNVNPKDNLSVQNWAKTYLNGVRNGGKTSDGFMLRMPNLEMLWDGSNDCSVSDSSVSLRKLNEYAQYFTVPSTLDNTVKEMKKYYSAVDGNNNYWQFDDSIEYLEWVMIPSDSKGFDSTSLTTGGVINKDYTSFLIQLGTQKDEVFTPYQNTFNNLDTAEHDAYILLIATSIVCLFNMLIYIFMARKSNHTSTTLINNIRG